METTSGKLANGESYFFDRESKSLYLIRTGIACHSHASAQELVSAGDAHVYSRDSLARIQEAFRHIVLLG